VGTRGAHLWGVHLEDDPPLRCWQLDFLLGGKVFCFKHGPRRRRNAFNGRLRGCGCIMRETRGAQQPVSHCPRTRALHLMRCARAAAPL
jgi:hypothetical protein